MKKLKTTFARFATVLGIIFLAGCFADSVNTLESENQTMKPKNIQDKRVITDSFLARRLLLTSVRESKAKGGLMRIQVGMKNNRTGIFSSNEPYRIVYRFSWFDGDGTEVPLMDENFWKEKYIIPGDDVTISSIAPNKKCKDFKLRLKAIK